MALLRHLPAASAVLLISAVVAQAADPEGRFAVDGIGNQTCKAFATAVAGDDPALIANYAGWLGGFMTGYNVFTPQTFDVTPWQTTELLLAKLNRHCTEFPDRPFVEAAAGLIAALAPARFETESPMVSVRAKGKGIYLPLAMLGRVREALKAQGIEITTPDGQFDEAFSTALSKYQADKKLPDTGLPDQNTLNALFP